MDKEEATMIGFEIVAYAGEARSVLVEALSKARNGDFEAAERLVGEANESLVDAHNAQTDMLAKEASGENIELSFIMVHGQDHLMTTLLLKHQGALVIFKIVIATVFSFIFLNFFGLDGIWGISGLGFVSVMLSSNPAINLSITDSYGDKDDAAIYPFVVIPSLPAIPLIIMSVYINGGFGGVDWMLVISVFLPLVIGIIFGNLDKEFGKVFGAVMPASLMLLGWLLGQNMDMFEAIKSGVSGIIVTIIFMVLSMPLMYFIDKKVLKYDGLAGVSIATVAGMSTAVPATVGTALPAVAGDVTSATAQVLMAAIITSILAPIIVNKLHQKKN